MSDELRQLVAKRAEGLTREEIMKRITDAEAELARDLLRGGQAPDLRRAKAMATQQIGDEYPELTQLWDAAPSAPPVPVVKSEQDELAREIVWRHIERRVAAQIDPLLSSHEHEIRKVAGISAFITKTPEGKRLYALYDRLPATRTLHELEQDAPTAASEVRKLLP